MTTTDYPAYGDTSTDWAGLGVRTLIEREPVINPTGRWEYEDGLVLGAVRTHAARTSDQAGLEYVRRNIDAYIGPDGEIRGYEPEADNLDHVNNGKVVLDLWEATGEERYRLAADRLFAQLKRQPRLEAGVFWHKRIYPNQVWLDGLYMGSVFYARYCALFGREDLLDDVAHQFTAAYELTLEESTGLCVHACDETRSMYWADPVTGHSPHVWLRALGWFVMAMVDVLEFLPVDHAGHQAVATNLRSLLASIQRVADPATNLWYQVPDQGPRPMNYLESSGSFMILAAIAKGLRCGYLDETEWADALATGWAGAVEQFLSIDSAGWVNVHKMCYVAGLGGATRRDGSYAYYMSEPIVTNDHKGVGPFLLLASEMQVRGV